MGRARTQRISGSRFLWSGIWQRQGGIAELTQRVIAAAQEFAFHRQGRVLAVMGARSQLVVVGVIRGTASGGALRRFEGRPPQLRGALTRQKPGEHLPAEE